MTFQKRVLSLLCATVLGGALLSPDAHALTHTVIPGDTMWKLAVRYKVGTSEIITANPQVADPDLIYPGESLNIPQLDQGVLSFESEVVRLVNAIRRESGLGELSLNWELSRVARYKSQDMADNFYFSHTSPIYGSPFQMIQAFGLTYRTAGENIAYGYPTPQAVVNSWMNSEGHRKNILNPSFTQIGVGYVSQGNHWTQMFIG